MSFIKFKTETKYVFALVSVFLVSRLIFHLILKFEFDYGLVNYLIQYLDPKLLREDFWESIFYLHTQPPFFNFLIGVIETTIQQYSYEFFFILFLLIGLLTGIYLFKIMLFFEFSNLLGFILTTIYMIIPPTILYENFFFYTHLIVFLMIISIYSLIKFIKLKKLLYLTIYLSSLSLCVLITSFFHLFWFLLMIYLSTHFTKLKKTIILYSILPLILILSVYIKNFVIFDSFSSSSWIGLNLSRISVYQLPDTLINKLVKEKQISEIAMLPSFPEFSDLTESEIFNFDSSGIQVLDQSIKSSGKTNYNHIVYLNISKLAIRDVKYVLINYPEFYFKGVMASFHLYFLPPNNFDLLEPNSQKFRKYNRFFNAFFYGSSPDVQIGWFSVIIIPLLIIFGIVQLFSIRVERNQKFILMFIIINILYVMIVGNLLELGENNRFRYYTEILFFILGGIVIMRFWHSIKFVK